MGALAPAEEPRIKLWQKSSGVLFESPGFSHGENVKGLKHCSTRRPVAGDYLYSGTVRAESPDKVYTLLKSLSREENSPRTIPPIMPGDIIVIEGFAYMALKGGWISVSFNEKEAYI